MLVVASVSASFGTGADSPLFVLSQGDRGFPDRQLTTAFTVHAVSLLASLPLRILVPPADTARRGGLFAALHL
ncbi:hypothetical protein ACIBQ5_36580 [Streptomyces massasporeus]|uniref:hypothetical protein n=1 Tax=Streptomyces massasporeus TaxID=67324 RepID=UPI0037985B8B